MNDEVGQLREQNKSLRGKIAKQASEQERLERAQLELLRQTREAASDLQNAEALLRKHPESDPDEILGRLVEAGAGQGGSNRQGGDVEGEVVPMEAPAHPRPEQQQPEGRTTATATYQVHGGKEIVFRNSPDIKNHADSNRHAPAKPHSKWRAVQELPGWIQVEGALWLPTEYMDKIAETGGSGRQIQGKDRDRYQDSDGVDTSFTMETAAVAAAASERWKIDGPEGFLREFEKQLMGSSMIATGVLVSRSELPSDRHHSVESREQATLSASASSSQDHGDGSSDNSSGKYRKQLGTMRISQSSLSEEDRLYVAAMRRVEERLTSGAKRLSEIEEQLKEEEDEQRVSSHFIVNSPATWPCHAVHALGWRYT